MRFSVQPGSTAAMTSVALLALLASCRHEPERPPNVVLVTFDTTRADAVSCLGGLAGTTPVVDTLAAEGALFSAAYSDANVTNPSHVSLLSGLPCIEHGVFSNKTPVPTSLDALPRAFARAGYRTGAFVSVRHLADAGWSGFERLDEVPGALPAQLVSDSALEWLAAKDSRPFFLWLHYYDPHAIYAPPPHLERQFYPGDPAAGSGPRIVDGPYFDEPRQVARQSLFEWLGDTRDPEWPRAMYQAELHYADRQLGRVLDAVHQSGRLTSTAVVVTSDHGEGFGEHGVYYGHRGLTEDQLHVPLVVRIPDAEPMRWDEPVSLLDVAPTLAELCGLEMEHEFAGTSLLPILRGRGPAASEPREFVFHHAQNQQVALREADWKLIWTMVEVDSLPTEPGLYDLSTDPGETRNLAAEHPERVDTMRARLAPWIDLGFVSKKPRADLSEDALEELRRLGYVDHEAE